MARAGLSPDAVVAAAIGLIDDRGPQALTLASVASRVGVATPSLYKHVDGLPELKKLLAIRVMDQLTARITAAVVGRSGADAVRQLMLAYRGYALDHPHRYMAMPQNPSDDAEWTAAGERLLTVLYAVLAGCGLTETQTIDQVRCIRAAVHGFVTLHIAGGFQMAESVDDSYERLITLLVSGLSAEGST